MVQLRFSDGREEVAFMVQRGRRQNRTCLWLRLVYASFWMSGLATLAQQYYKDESEMCLVPGAKSRMWLLLLDYGICVLAQLVGAVQLYTRRTRRDYAQQENREAILSVTLAVCSMVCAMLMRPGQLSAAHPVNTMLILGWFNLFEMFRLETALKLHALHFMCFLLTEVDMVLVEPSGLRTQHTFLLDLATVVVGGVVVPLIMAIVMEARLRLEFLIRYHGHVGSLGAFWTWVACRRDPDGIRRRMWPELLRMLVGHAAVPRNSAVASSAAAAAALAAAAAAATSVGPPVGPDAAAGATSETVVQTAAKAVKAAAGKVAGSAAQRVGLGFVGGAGEGGAARAAGGRGPDGG
ncbi:hypothetical protein WJX72_007822 [[Myrmecia] bisecta]|uniref:Uncharacterized protein n=1 Tax=[Myrmecia] bisecta TaxID=41462 RepID=A0AAW1P4Y5_9CHLO